MQRMDKSIRDCVKRDLRWYIYGVTSILFGIVLYYLRFPEGDVSSIVKILEVIPSLLATILSLSFTTIFIIAQMTRWGYLKVVNMMGFKFFIVFFFYLVGIIFPLVVLKSGINILEQFGIGNAEITNLSITTSITITVFCLLIVLAYLQDMREIMRKDAIPRLIQEAMQAIESRNENLAVELIKELALLGESFTQ